MDSLDSEFYKNKIIKPPVDAGLHVKSIQECHVFDNHWLNPFANLLKAEKAKHGFMWLSLPRTFVGVVDFRSRLGNFTTPWNTKSNKTLFAVPELKFINDRLSDIMDERATELLAIANKQNKKIAVMWSGGIDSTAVLISFLRNTTNQEKKNVVVLCSSSSIYENTNFYLKHILKKLECINSADLTITNNFLNNHVLVHGDPADAIFGPSMPMYKNFLKENTHMESWKKHRAEIVKTLNNEINPSSRHELNSGYGDWIFDKISNTIIESKNDDYVSSVADWWWWTYFNFKWEFSVCRPLYYYRVRDYNNPIDKSTFSEYVKNTFFHTDKFQLWTYSNLKTLIGYNGMNHKSLIKQYIYDYNKDENYFLNKKKIGSAPPTSDLKSINQSNPVYWDKEWRGHTYYEEGHLQKVVYILLKKFTG